MGPHQRVCPSDLREVRGGTSVRGRTYVFCILVFCVHPRPPSLLLPPRQPSLYSVFSGDAVFCVSAPDRVVCSRSMRRQPSLY